MDIPRIVLASASPRRRQILEASGIEFDVVIAEVDEEVFASEPARTVAHNASRKAAWVMARHPSRLVMAADTVVAFHDRLLVKPSTLSAARTMLRDLSGREQCVYTAVSVGGAGAPLDTRVETSRVRFRHLSESDIDTYFARVDPLDKAGAYNIDEHPELIIESLEGSRTNVMGLPRELALRMLRQAGYG